MSSTNYERYRWTSIWLSLGTFLGIAFVIWFSVEAKLNTGVLLLWAMAYFVIGGLFGFIFSVPKVITENPQPGPNPPPTGAVTAGQQGDQSPPPGNGQGGSSSASSIPLESIVKTRAQENTNLTQISDWLTKILIGAALVQIKAVPGFIHHIAAVMGKGLSDQTNTLSSVTMMCAAVILYFITWGFICGYLVMKLVLTDQFVNQAAGDSNTN